MRCPGYWLKLLCVESLNYAMWLWRDGIQPLMHPEYDTCIENQRLCPIGNRELATNC